MVRYSSINYELTVINVTFIINTTFISLTSSFFLNNQAMQGIMVST